MCKVERGGWGLWEVRKRREGVMGIGRDGDKKRREGVMGIRRGRERRIGIMGG